MARRTDHNWAIGELADGSIPSFAGEQTRIAIIWRDAFQRAFEEMLSGEDNEKHVEA